MSVSRVSEERGAFGGVSADGMINVLGRPKLSILELVLREAAQNAWDARIRPSASVPAPAPPEFLVRLRTLKATEKEAFRELFLDPAKEAEKPTSNELLACLAAPHEVRVLELCDFGTSGLSGPVNSHAPAAKEDNFRNFFFDVGEPHFESGDGGTYGYGRSALYLASKARTIVVDSLVPTRAGTERRIMACRIGHAFERPRPGGTSVRYTGRHFWGVAAADRGVEPLLDERAVTLARRLGTPSRDEGRTGTSILIPWPVSVDLSGAEIYGSMVWDALLCHLWPKVVSTSGPFAMRLGVEEDGKRVPQPRLLDHPIYGMFASALLMARDRSGASGASPVELQRPRVVTGHLGLEVGTAPSTAVPTDGDGDGQSAWYSEGVHHVALMRPSELVVRYLDIPEARPDGRQWAGVFICSDDPYVRTAFAASEPPAHDDWVPDRIDDQRARRLVHQTVGRYIPEIVRTVFGTARRQTSASEAQVSLASAADAFANQFLAGEGTAAALAPSGTLRRTSRPRGPRLGRPALVGLSFENETKIATYRLEVTGVRGSGVMIRASASVVTDGGVSGDAPLGVELPEVLGWRVFAGAERTLGSLHLKKDRDVLIDVAFRGEYALAVACLIEDER